MSFEPVTGGASDPWTVVWSGPAARSMSRLPEKVVTAVASFVEGPLALNPKRTTKELREPYAGKRSGRVGKAYRVIVSLDEDSRTVRILAVDHRSDVYRVRP